MKFDEAFKNLTGSDKFKEWGKSNSGSFFAYALKIDDENSDWHIGFYLHSKDKMVSFILGPGRIEIQPEEEVFKKPDTKVMPIEIKSVKIQFDEALKIARSFQEENYSKEVISKKISILQSLEDYGLVWNITFIMHSFQTLNIKLSAETGKIMSHNLESLMDFAKK